MTTKKTTRRQYRLNGKRLPSVTTILDQANKPALLPWAAGCGARALARMLDEGVSIDAALERVRIEWQKERKAAADAGTRAHAFLEAWARDEESDADLEVELDREAHRLYQAGVAHLQSTGSRVIIAEVGLKGSSGQMAFGGTFDLVVERADGLWLADWKTGARVYGDSVVPQLAAYLTLWQWMDAGMADGVDPDLDLSPMVGRSKDVVGALVLHLPLVGDITEHAISRDQLASGWEYFEACYRLHALKPSLTIHTEKTAEEASDD